MPKIEKGGPPESRPKILSLQDNPDIANNFEFRQAPLIEMQIFLLARRCAISAPMASALAPLIWSLRS
jgi:hypothetical protein